MVRAILAGQKTQTRRVIKPVQPRDDGMWPAGRNPVADCPYGQLGDRLWIRETWKYSDWTDDGQPYVEYAASPERKLCENIPEEWSDRLLNTWASLSAGPNYAIDQRAADRRWRPSIHMPRWACRLELEITGVRVERLQDITEEDATAEGITDGGCLNCGESEPCECSCPEPSRRDSFANLWMQINGTHSWQPNPWVWVIEFKRVTP